MRMLKDLINIGFLVLGHLFPRSRQKIVFGAWNGNSYSDNPKFLFEFFFAHPEFRIVWIGNKSVRSTLPPLPPHASFAVRHSLLGLWHAFTAKTWVFSHSTNDIALVAIWGRALLLDTCHGVALKQVGEMCPGWKKGNSSPLSRLLRNPPYLAMPSEWQSQNTLAGFPGSFKSPTLPFGSTTLDFILANKDNAVLIASLRQKFVSAFGLPSDRKWIVYAPTFRHLSEKNYSFRDASADERRKLDAVLNAIGAVMVEKLHPNRITDQNPESDGHVFSIAGPAAKTIEPHELWLAADAIVSDYSSCVVPFFLQGKPVIHFVYDYDYYTKEDTGLVADLDDIRFGVVAKNFDELCNAISRFDEARNQCGKRARDLIEYEDGHSCEKYLDFIRTRHRTAVGSARPEHPS